MQAETTLNHKNIAYLHKKRNNNHKNQEQQRQNHRLQTWKKSSTIKASPSVIIGKSGRNSTEKKQVPGPGTYDLSRQSSLDKKMVSFKGSRLLRCHTDSPGPCAYQPSSMFSSKKYSFSRCKNISVTEARPGPGTYNVKPVDSSKACGFPRKQRDPLNEKSKESIPGPGNYLWKEPRLSKKDYSFAKTKKFLQQEQEISEKQVIPGPGAYQTQKGRHKIQSFKFSQALRNLNTRIATPGPGSYQTEMSAFLQNGRSISREKRQFNYANGIPGPGNYKEVSVESLKHRDPRVAFTRSKTDHGMNSIQIGPGAYHKQSLSKVLGGVIGKQKRQYNQNSITPSPVNYDPKYEEILTKSAHISFGKQARISSAHHETPGPGYYNIDGQPNSLIVSQHKRVNPTQFDIRRTSEPYRRQNTTTLSHM